MSQTCETVVIETEAGHVVINKSDYDEKIHKLAAGESGDEGMKEGSKPWLKAQLDAMGVEYPEGISKGELKELYELALAAG